MNPFEAYSHARALWPEKIVCATEFQNAAGRHCKISRMQAGAEPERFYGASFEECFAKAQEESL
jgi:hypothetical protein